MAEQDPRQIAQSGIDPTTGSPLSKESRKALFRGAKLSSIVPSNGSALAIRPQQKLVDDEQNALIIRTTQTNESLQQQINRLREELAILSAGLTNIGNILQTEGIVEKNRLLQEQEQERRNAEAKVRVGSESQLEQKIQAALIAPVAALQGKVENIFGRIGSALSTLFLGWLGVQGLKAIKAYSDNNIEQLTNIKDTVLKNVGAALAGLGAIRTGFSLVTSTVKAVTFGLVKLLARGISLPFQLAGAGARALTGKGFNMPGLRMPRMPGLGMIGKGLSRLLTPINLGISAYRFSQGDVVGGALSAASAIPIIGLPAIGVDIAREFGAFEGTPLGKNEKTPAPEIPKPAAPQKPPTAKVSPQTPAKPESAAISPQPPPPAQPQTPATPAPAAFNFNVDNQNKFSFTENPLQMQSDESMTQNVDVKPAETQQPDISSTINSAQIQPTKSKSNITQLPDAKPNIVYRRIGENSSSPSVTPSSGPLTDVPLIDSSNPDNFYSLYSQLQYNVVI